MKIKTILGLIACAGACASYSAFGGNGHWFEVSTSTTNNAAVTCESTDADAIKIVSEKFVIDTDESKPVVITPTADASVTNTSDGVVFITATAELTASSMNDLEPIEGAKAGFAVAYDDNNVTSFWGYASGESPNWFKLQDETPRDGETTFKLELDYRTGKQTVKFYVRGTQLSDGTTNAFDIAATSLSQVDVWGCGKLASVDTDFEVAVASVEVEEGVVVKYGSYGEAISAASAVGKGPDDIAATDALGEASNPGAEAVNGLKVWQCEAIGVAGDEQIQVVKSTKQNANKITLAADTEGQDPSVVVKYSVNGVGEYDADDIQIPMDVSGTYKITPIIRAK